RGFISRTLFYTLLAARVAELSPRECLSVAKKIAGGMEYVASMRIVHRDLSARNILVGETIDDIKISDFILARTLAHSRYYITYKEAFPIRWTAPEAIVIFQSIVPVKEGRITAAADVWSFAVVMWELYTNGQEPYGEINCEELYHVLTENYYRLAKPDKCPAEIYAKMLECWHFDPNARPTFYELHQFLSLQMG
ncbi:hypothetical protein PMAYCL1PPCAC_21697, partial [Pristionchus mayeri]